MHVGGGDRPSRGPAVTRGAEETPAHGPGRVSGLRCGCSAAPRAGPGPQGSGRAGPAGRFSGGGSGSGGSCRLAA